MTCIFNIEYAIYCRQWLADGILNSPICDGKAKSLFLLVFLNHIGDTAIECDHLWGWLFYATHLQGGMI